MYPDNPISDLLDALVALPRAALEFLWRLLDALALAVEVTT